jgi:hypothetical protein
VGFAGSFFECLAGSRLLGGIAQIWRLVYDGKRA